ncbi:MAG: hypothetical protein KHZ62_04535 [Clostridiales bacterium]|nr:hypothetical protein [Clostridiales bacterium]
MIQKALIIPTGDEMKAGIVLDTDSPMIMQNILKLNPLCSVTRRSPVEDKEDNIVNTIKESVEKGYDFIVLIGGSGGGHRFSSTLGKDFTHSSLELLLENKHATELYGKNGHLWSKLLVGTIQKTVVLNVPGPYREAEAAISAFCDIYPEHETDFSAINQAMSAAVRAQYGDRAL